LIERLKKALGARRAGRATRLDTSMLTPAQPHTPTSPVSAALGDVGVWILVHAVLVKFKVKPKPKLNPNPNPKVNPNPNRR